jgi:4-amino-4-deoxychorismate lyase
MKKAIFVESIKIDNGMVHHLRFHQERMWQTALFHYGTKPTLKIDKALIPLHLQNETIKCRVLYAADILSIEFHPYQFKKIQSLQIVEDNNISYNYKSTDRNCFNHLFEQRKGADEIIIAKNGILTDSSFSNLVFESLEGKLVTPHTCLLAGTKRKFLLQSGIIKEKEIMVDNLSLYKKVYLINAMINLEDDISVPVSSITV